MTTLTIQDREAITAYISSLCVPLLDRPEGLSVSFEDADAAVGRFGCPAGTGLLVVISVPPLQMGYLLGRGGVTAESIRHLTRCWASARKWGFRIDVRVATR